LTNRPIRVIIFRKDMGKGEGNEVEIGPGRNDRRREVGK